MTRPSQKLLNESGETRNPCLVPDVRKKKHQFLAMKYVSFRFVIYGLYYVEVHSHCTHFVESFVFFCNTLKLNVVKTVSVSIQIMIWLLVFISIINQFIVPEPFLYPWDESHLTVMYDTFNELWNLISYYLVEDICVYIYH